MAWLGEELTSRQGRLRAPGPSREEGDEKADDRVWWVKRSKLSLRTYRTGKKESEGRAGD